MLSKLAISPLYLMSKIMDNMKNLTMLCTLFGVGICVVDYCFAKSKLKSWALKKEKHIFFDCFFMTDKGFRGIESAGNTLVPVTEPLVDFIDAANYTLDMCFFVITATNVVEAILAAKKRKVAVSVIVDYNVGLFDNEHSRRLLRAGITICARKMNQSVSQIMHHKFCIRDKEVLLQASMNLTQTSVKGSFDNILITNCPDLVVPFQGLFDEMLQKITSG